MKIKILPQAVVDITQSEDELLDCSVIESIYEIRTLKAAIELADKEIEITKTNGCGQVFLDSHDIWLKAGTFVEL